MVEESLKKIWKTDAKKMNCNELAIALSGFADLSFTKEQLRHKNYETLASYSTSTEKSYYIQAEIWYKIFNKKCLYD